MSLRERLQDDMKTALKARESVRLDTVRSIRGAVRNKEIEVGGDLDEDGILRVIRTLAKQRRESIEQYAAAGRQDLVERETAELGVLEAYLPSAPDEAAIEAAVRAVIEETPRRSRPTNQPSSCPTNSWKVFSAKTPSAFCANAGFVTRNSGQTLISVPVL